MKSFKTFIEASITKEYDPTPGGMEWGTEKGTDYYKRLTPGQTPGQDQTVEPESSADYDYNFSEEDLTALNYSADNFSWEDAINFGLYDDDELEEEEADYDDNELEAQEEEYLQQGDINEVLSTQGRLKRRFTARRNRQKLTNARRLALRRGSSPDRLKRRSVRGARSMVYKRLMSGRKKAGMPPAEKQRMEAMMKRFNPLVSRLAVRILPNMRKMELHRMKTRSSRKPQHSKKYKASKPINTSSKSSKKTKK
jgi:hypothetical protein